MDDEGNFYSKRPLTKTMARQQQKALYASEARKDMLIGRGYSSYVDDEGNHHLVLSGEGFFSDLWTKAKVVGNKIASVFTPVATTALQKASDVVATGVRKGNYPPKARETLAKYGAGEVYDLLVIREPIQSFINKALDAITFGRWNQAKKELNYDNMFHLSMIASVAMPNGDKARIKIEKNEVINITDDFALKNGVSAGVSQHGSGQRTEAINVPVPCCITLQEMMDKAQKATGDKFFLYDAFNNNCQSFLLYILSANDLLTQEVKTFIQQDALSLLQKLPTYTKPFSTLLTNIAGLANRVMYGEGEDELDWAMEAKGMRGSGFNQKMYDELQASIPSKEKWEASYKRRGIQPTQTYEQYKKQVEEINKKRAYVDEEAQARTERMIEEARINNEMYAQRVAENPDLEDVMCNYDQQGNRRKTRMTKGECREANAKGFAEWERVNRPENYYFFRPAVDAIAKTTSFLADVVPGIPAPIRKIGKFVADAGLEANSYTPRERGQGKPFYISETFRKQLKKEGMTPEEYLKVVREIADSEGYDGRAVEFADDDDSKLMIYDDEGKKHYFGKVGYNDYILWSKQEALGKVRQGYAEMKRRVFNKSHSAIKGDWKKDKYSPNNLAIKILW